MCPGIVECIDSMSAMKECRPKNVCKTLLHIMWTNQKGADLERSVPWYIAGDSAITQERDFPS